MTCPRVVLVKHALPILDPSRPAREWRLGDEGEAQSRRLADRLRAFSPLRLVASPEPKAFKTGQVVAAELELPITSVDGLEEFDRPVLPMMSKAEYERVNAKDELIRVIDESGEDYLFARQQFAFVNLPQAVKRRMLAIERAS